MCYVLLYLLCIIQLKREEKDDETAEGMLSVWTIHKDAILGFMWLFLGFIIAFSFWNVAIGNSELFNAQLSTYCAINDGGNIDNCVAKYSQEGTQIEPTGAVAGMGRLFSILENNIYVMIFTLYFIFNFWGRSYFLF